MQQLGVDHKLQGRETERANESCCMQKEDKSLSYLAVLMFLKSTLDIGP